MVDQDLIKSKISQVIAMYPDMKNQLEMMCEHVISTNQDNTTKSFLAVLDQIISENDPNKAKKAIEGFAAIFQKVDKMRRYSTFNIIILFFLGVLILTAIMLFVSNIK